MAKRAKTPVKKTATKELLRDVQVVMVTPSDLPFYYVNHIEVSNSQYEVAITAARAPARLSHEQLQQVQEQNQLILEPSVQLLIPTNLLGALITALQTQKEKYESAFARADNQGKK